MVIAGTATISRSDRAIDRQLADGGGAVLLNLDTGAYYALNPMGLLIWSLLSEDLTFERLVARVRSEIEDAPPTLEDEIAQFLGMLEKRELVVIRG
jgi:coenzyme PQQ synthesis protein D (PqqD)